MIKKHWKKIGFFSLFVGVLFGNLVSAGEFDIKIYDVNAKIRIDGTIDVNEKIDVDFHQSMHGIERFFPKYYEVGDLEFQVFYDGIKVNNDNYQILDYGDEINARIGDADILVNGEHNYNIDYSTYGLIRNFSGMGYSELYWNVIGYEWDSNINKVKIQISLPKSYTGFTADDFLISAGYSYEGNIDFEGEISRDENNIYITYDKNLPPYEGITLAIKFPNNYFEYDHEKQASLFVGYTHDFRVQNYKLHGNISKTGNITFKNDIELEILNENPHIFGKLPYKYSFDGKNPLIKIKDVSINGVDYDVDEYDTTNSYKVFHIGNLSGISNISANYSIYGLVRPFSGSFSEWTHNLYATSGDFNEREYRLYLRLPILDLNEKINNFEVSLGILGGCGTIYAEDIYVNLGDGFINMREFNENYGSIGCKDDKLTLVYSGEIDDYENIQLNINFVKGTFDLDEELLEALAVVGDGQFYYGDKVNTPSLLFLLGMLIFGGGFGALMARRYKNNSKKDNHIIQYDTPKGVESPEAGILIDDKLDPRDITSLIYLWAANKYIKICAEDTSNKKFYIKKLKNLSESAKDYQKNLFKKLFSNGDDFYFSVNKSKFADYLVQTEKELTKHVDSQNWFTTTLSNVKLNAYSFKSGTKSWIFWVVVIWGLGYCFAVTGINQTLNSVWSGMIPIFWIGLIGIICSYRNKEKEQGTKKGIEFRNHCMGYKEFLEKVDKKKIEELTKQDPLFIEKSLPYAVVFGIGTEFIKKITPEMLSWYDGDIDSLLSSLSYIGSFVKTAGYSSFGGNSGGSSYSYSSSSGHSGGSSFSGGGFSSGGGGGGGGGRGW